MMRTGHLAGILTLLTALTACGAQTGAPLPATTTSSEPAPTTSSGPATKVEQAATTSHSSGSSSSATTTRPPQATATISVVKQPTCPVHGTPDAPFTSPGTDVVIGWKVTGATGSAIAVDNPGIYGAYGMYAASGQLTLAFPCDDKPGKTTHSYTVWPAGNKNVFKTISVSATNNP